MSKVIIIDKKLQNPIIFERELLSKLRSPFIVNLTYSFQDYDYLYLVMDYLKGGDLRYNMCKTKNFSEKQTKFFLSCLILGLEYIHSFNIIHRDIKPENLLLDSKGYLRITDFGISKLDQKYNGYDKSGTPGYMAPEVLNGKNHNKDVDFYAMGIIGYELMIGDRPYKGKTRKEIREEMIIKKAIIKKDQIPKNWTKISADFFNKLLIYKPENRIGHNNINEIKNHEWFSDIDWKLLFLKKINSPYIPNNKEGNFDKKFCNYVEKESLDTLKRYYEIFSSPEYENCFINFTYYPLADIEEKEKEKKENGNINNSAKNDKIKNKIFINHKRYLSNDYSSNLPFKVFCVNALTYRDQNKKPNYNNLSNNNLLLKQKIIDFQKNFVLNKSKNRKSSKTSSNKIKNKKKEKICFHRNLIKNKNNEVLTINYNNNIKKHKTIGKIKLTKKMMPQINCWKLLGEKYIHSSRKSNNIFLKIVNNNFFNLKDEINFKKNHSLTNNNLNCTTKSRKTISESPKSMIQINQKFNQKSKIENLRKKLHLNVSFNQNIKINIHKNNQSSFRIFSPTLKNKLIISQKNLYQSKNKINGLLKTNQTPNREIKKIIVRKIVPFKSIKNTQLNSARLKKKTNLSLKILDKKISNNKNFFNDSLSTNEKSFYKYRRNLSNSNKISNNILNKLIGITKNK